MWAESSPFPCPSSTAVGLILQLCSHWSMSASIFTENAGTFPSHYACIYIQTNRARWKKTQMGNQIVGRMLRTGTEGGQREKWIRELASVSLSFSSGRENICYANISLNVSADKEKSQLSLSQNDQGITHGFSNTPSDYFRISFLYPYLFFKLNFHRFPKCLGIIIYGIPKTCFVYLILKHSFDSEKPYI